MSVSENYWQGVFLALVSAITIGVSGFIYKLGISNYENPLQYSIMITFIGLVVAILYYWKVQGVSCNRLFPSPRDAGFKWVLGLGLVGTGLVTIFRFLGLIYTTGTFGTLAQVLTTVLTVFFMHLLYKEVLPKVFYVLLPVMLLGMVGVTSSSFDISQWNIGDTLIVVSALCVTIANVFAKEATKLGIHADTLTVSRLFYGLVLLIAFFIVFGSWVMPEVNYVVLSIVAGVLLSLNFIAFYKSILIIGMSLAVSLLMFAPIITMILERIFLGEIFSFTQIFSSLVVIICGLIILHQKNRMMNIKN